MAKMAAIRHKWSTKNAVGPNARLRLDVNGKLGVIASTKLMQTVCPAESRQVAFRRGRWRANFSTWLIGCSKPRHLDLAVGRRNEDEELSNWLQYTLSVGFMARIGSEGKLPMFSMDVPY